MKIVLVEDHENYAKNLAYIINQDKRLSCTHIFPTANEAWESISDIKMTEVVLLDIGLPDYSGILLLEKLKKALPDLIYIVLTIYEEEDKLFNSLKAGANGYILKSDSPTDIIEAILSTKKGNAPMSMSIAKKVCNHFYNLSQKVHKIDQLSPRENEILEALSNGLLYKEIAGLYNISIDTVKKHCGNIYKKLHVFNRTEAINLYNKKK